MLGEDFAFHLLAKRNDIAVGNNAHFVGFLDANEIRYDLNPVVQVQDDGPGRPGVLAPVQIGIAVYRY